MESRNQLSPLLCLPCASPPLMSAKVPQPTKYWLSLACMVMHALSELASAEISSASFNRTADLGQQPAHYSAGQMNATAEKMPESWFFSRTCAPASGSGTHGVRRKTVFALNPATALGGIFW